MATTIRQSSAGLNPPGLGEKTVRFIMLLILASTITAAGCFFRIPLLGKDLPGFYIANCAYMLIFAFLTWGVEKGLAGKLDSWVIMFSLFIGSLFPDLVIHIIDWNATIGSFMSMPCALIGVLIGFQIYRTSGAKRRIWFVMLVAALGIVAILGGYLWERLIVPVCR